MGNTQLESYQRQSTNYIDPLDVSKYTPAEALSKVVEFCGESLKLTRYTLTFVADFEAATDRISNSGKLLQALHRRLISS
jgi:hypothetical protein